MSVDIKELYFKVADFIGLVHGAAKTKLAILAFMYCGEFVKNSSVKVISLLFAFLFLVYYLSNAQLILEVYYSFRKIFSNKKVFQEDAYHPLVNLHVLVATTRCQ